MSTGAVAIGASVSDARPALVAGGATFELRRRRSGAGLIGSTPSPVIIRAMVFGL